MSTLPPRLLEKLTIGAGAGLLLGCSLRERPKTRAEWLARFQSWAGPVSVSEDDRVARTERMIKGTLAGASELCKYDLRVFGQGSSINNTNVKIESDLDLLALSQIKWWVAAPGEQLPSGFETKGINFSYQYWKLRNNVFNALESRFPDDGVEDGNKCIRVGERSGARVRCDVLPCFRAHRFHHSSRWQGGVPTFDTGVIFGTDLFCHSVSFPEQHLENGRMKNVRTGHRYKQVVRVLKKLRAEQGSETILTDELPSSFEIECLVHNVPDHVLRNGDIFDAVTGSLDWMKGALRGPESVNRLLRVNGIEFLFPSWEPLLGNLLGHAVSAPDKVCYAQSFVDSCLNKIGST